MIQCGDTIDEESVRCEECGWHHYPSSGHWTCVVCGKPAPAGYGMWAALCREDEEGVFVHTGPCWRQYEEGRKAADLLACHGQIQPCHLRGCLKPAIVAARSPRWHGERMLCEYCLKTELRRGPGAITESRPL